MPIASSIGPPLGAFLLPQLGVRGLFLLDAAVCLTCHLANAAKPKGANCRGACM